MLVLSRKTSESIVIGEGDNQITVTVVKTGPFQVRIGIDAPKSMKVVRSELLEKKP